MEGAEGCYDWILSFDTAVETERNVDRFGTANVDFGKGSLFCLSAVSGEEKAFEVEAALRDQLAM